MSNYMTLTKEQEKKIEKYIEYLQVKYNIFMSYKITDWESIQIYDDNNYLVRDFSIEEIDIVLLHERLTVLK